MGLLTLPFRLPLLPLKGFVRLGAASVVISSRAIPP